MKVIFDYSLMTVFHNQKWFVFKILVNMSLSKLTDAYQRTLHRRFLLVQCIQTGLLMSTGDVISQQLVESKGHRNHHYKRTWQFAFLGCCLVVRARLDWFHNPQVIIIKLIEKIINNYLLA